MRRLALGIALLYACGSKNEGPLSAEELAPFQACTTKNDCVLARNGPRTCCSETPFDGLVAVARASVSSLEMEFTEVECASREVCEESGGPAVLEDRFELECVSSVCTIVVEHEHSGEACSELSCPQDYLCVSETCFYEPAHPSCALQVRAPIVPEGTVEPAPLKLACLPGWTETAGPEASFCTPPALAAIFEPCGPDGFAEGLPDEGVVRISQGESIAAAIAAPGTIVALGEGVFDEALVLDETVTLWGCGAGTVLSPSLVSWAAVQVDSGAVTLRNLQVQARGDGVVARTSAAEIRLVAVSIVSPLNNGWVVTEGARGIGEGVWIHASTNTAVASLQGALIEGTGWMITGSGLQGIVAADGATVTASDVWVTETSVNDPATDRGFAVAAINGARAEITRGYFARNRNATFLASGAESLVTAEQVIVAGTLNDGSAVVATLGGAVTASAAVLSDSQGDAVYALLAGTVFLEKTKIAGAVGACAFSEGEGSVIELRGSRIERCARAGLEIDRGARIYAEETSIGRAGIAGVLAQGQGSTFELREVSIEELSLGGFGVALAAGANGRLRAVWMAGMFQAGVFATTGASLSMNDVAVRGGGRGVSIEQGASLNFDGLSVDGAREVGLAALSEGTVVGGVELSVRDTAGIGAAAYRGAELSVDRFHLTDNMPANVARGSTSHLVLGTGRLERAPIGLALAGVVSEPLLVEKVCFSENGVDVDSEDLAVPADVEFPCSGDCS
jgi:hypothetical protein